MPQIKAHAPITSQGTSMTCGNAFPSLKMGHKTPKKQSDIKHRSRDILARVCNVLKFLSR